MVLSILLHIPAVQKYTGTYVAQALSQKLGTKVSIGNINLGFLNRIIIDDVDIPEQSGREMLHISRLSTSVNPVELLRGNIRISSAQVFGLRAKLRQKDALSKPNFQFIVDSLSSSEGNESRLDLKINSFVIRHGSISFDRQDIPFRANRFSPYHLDISQLSTDIVLRHITRQNVNAMVKRFSFKEKSGLIVNDLTFSFSASENKARLEAFRLRFPNSTISSDSIIARYSLRNGNIYLPSLQINGNFTAERITPSDFAFLLPQLKSVDTWFRMNSTFTVTDNTLNIKRIHLDTPHSDFNFLSSATIYNINDPSRWRINIDDLSVGDKTLTTVSRLLYFSGINLPAQLTQLKNISLRGHCIVGNNTLYADGNITTNIGKIKFNAHKQNALAKSHIEANDIKVGLLIGDNRFGDASFNADISGRLQDKSTTYVDFKTKVSGISYNGYTYKDITTTGQLRGDRLSAQATIADPGCQAFLTTEIKGLGKAEKKADLKMNIDKIIPRQIGISNKWGDASFRMKLQATVSLGKALMADGIIDGFCMQTNATSYSIDRLTAHISPKHIGIDADFGSINIDGCCQPEEIKNCLMSVVYDKLPQVASIVGSNSTIRTYSGKRIWVNARISDTRWAEKLLGIPIQTNGDIVAKATVDSGIGALDADITVPSFDYNGQSFRNARLVANTHNDTLTTECSIRKILDTGNSLDLHLKSNATGGLLDNVLDFDYHSAMRINGKLRTEMQLGYDNDNKTMLKTEILPSTVTVQDTTWTVSPATVIYNDRKLQVNHFAIAHGQQHIKIDGRMASSPDDSINVALKEVDVNYILNLVNFHSVTFDGKASGTAVVKRTNGTPEASAKLCVDDFRFQDGRMGTLYANVGWNGKESQIDIDAHADDTINGGSTTIIKGYVSPSRNYIDLGITAHDTNIEFLKSFCNSFMGEINAHANGFAQVYGPLSSVNLKGKLVVDGSIGIKPLRTVYTLKSDTIVMQPNEIVFQRALVADDHGGTATVSGGLHHKNLTKLTFDLDIEAHRFLCYDHRDYGSDSFYGTVYGTGSCTITGRPHSIVFDINMKPEAQSFIEYNAASPDAITDRKFLSWVSHEATDSTLQAEHDNGNAIRNVKRGQTKPDDASDMVINFQLDATPDFTLRVLMDKATGDKIALQGNGAIKATYFNKGGFDMYGTYMIEHGTYDLTIQNIIRKQFQFQNGSSIIFGGNPFNSSLNLKAVYPINGVSLADLKIGNSFANNNVRVDCIMNIGGTPEAIKVDFDFDMPTVNNDAKQMVRSIINSEEEMSQQVVYLLAIGRFYTDGKNNSQQEDAQQSQTSLAMQSLLSGTISQQVNSILSSVIKNNNWNFGTNISTGTEGLSNAEYEGILSGSLFTGRLLINGQFGYRDNPNTTSSFIGDFDIKYLLTPSGSVAIKVYNQTNDRYFTKSSLNTQGLGIVLKKDFKNWWSLFKRKRKK